MKKSIVAILFLISGISFRAFTQNASIKEELIEFRTYGFHDADPVVDMNKIYPYFSYDGYETQPVIKKWKIITLENEYIKVLIAPEVGGKILGAIEKSTGNEFLYYNKVMKFRKIAMRGPWTSGGVEFNFGTIGHTPMVATPVDYTFRQNEDGSVSCFIGADDLQPQTRWTVEIRLPTNKALFEIHTQWHNASNFNTSLYHWTNAAAAARTDLRFYYPGTTYIGHGGDAHPYPIGKNNTDLSLYGNNTFGGNKSFHILGKYTDTFGGYYEDLDFGFVHWSDYTDKPGKKLWMWSTARQGAIWEDLLTDADTGNGQYIEYQSGLLFNQASSNSSESPFKHLRVFPNETISFTESFFPVKNLGGITTADNAGTLFLSKNNNSLSINYCPVIPINDKLTVTTPSGTVLSKSLTLKPMEVYSTILENTDNHVKIMLGDRILYSFDEEERKSLDRPVSLEKFNYETAYGLYKSGLELSSQRLYSQAQQYFERCLSKNSTFLPALEELAELMLRKMDYEKALNLSKKALSIDTYSPKANYIFGLCHMRMGDFYNSLDGFSLASRNPGYKALSYREIAKLYIQKNNFAKGLEYAEKSLQYDNSSYSALHLKILALRLTGETQAAIELAEEESVKNPLNYLCALERILLKKTPDLSALNNSLKNEFAGETWLNLALTYYSLNQFDEAVLILENAPNSVMNNFWLAHLYRITDSAERSSAHLQKALQQPAKMVFPFRAETYDLLTELSENNPAWQLMYYRALILWSKQQKDEAIDLFQQLENKPDFSAFYLTRARLLEDVGTYSPRKDIERALQLDPDSWRAHIAMIGLLLKKYKTKEAVDFASISKKQFNNNFYLDFEFAKSLLLNSRYAASLEVLENTEILPNEGASAGRIVYRQACIMGAIENINTGDFKTALSRIEKSRLWPEHLGVGKPYRVDESLEDYLTAYIYQKTRSKKKAKNLFDELQQNDIRMGSSISNYIQLLILKNQGQEAKAKDLLSTWEKELKNSPGFEFMKSLYIGETPEINHFNSREPSLNRIWLEKQIMMALPK